MADTRISDMPARSSLAGSDAFENSAGGTSYETTLSSLLSWLRGQDSIKAARVYHNADQSISHNSVTKLAFNSERHDTDTIHDNASNNTRLTCVTAGKYQITVNVSFASNATGVRLVRILLNNTTVIANYLVDACATDRTVISLSTMYDLAAADYVEAQVFQTSGSSVNVEALGNYSPEFMMAKMG